MSEELHQCECETPGFCLRYNKRMTSRTHKICRGEVLTPEKCEAYRQSWLGQRKTAWGDVIHKVAKFTGMDRLAKKAAKVMGKEDCGCEERQKKINEAQLRKKK